MAAMVASLSLVLYTGLLGVAGLDLGIEAETRVGLISGEQGPAPDPVAQLYVTASTELHQSSPRLQLDARYFPRLLLPMFHPTTRRPLVLHRIGLRGEVPVSGDLSFDLNATGALGELDYSSVDPAEVSSDLETIVPDAGAMPYRSATIVGGASWNLAPRWTSRTEAEFDGLEMDLQDGLDQRQRVTLVAAERLRRSIDRRHEVGGDLEASRVVLDDVSFLGVTVAGASRHRLTHRLTVSLLAGTYLAWRRSATANADAPRWLGVGSVEAENVFPMTPSKRLIASVELTLTPYHDPALTTLDHRAGTTLRAALVLSNQLSLAANARWQLLVRGVRGRWQSARPGQTQHVGSLRAAVTYRLLGTFDVNFGLQGSSRGRAPRSPTDENMVRNELFAFASVAGSFGLIESRTAARASASENSQ